MIKNNYFIYKRIIFYCDYALIFKKLFLKISIWYLQELAAITTGIKIIYNYND